MLRHEARLADYGELAEYHTAVARDETPWSVDEMLQRIDVTRLRYVPGASWQYSNVGYIYVRRLIERLTGLTLEDALMQQVLGPLGLSEVQLVKAHADVAGVSVGIARTYNPGWVYHGLLVGSLASAAFFLDRLFAWQFLPDLLLGEM